jgi:predicted TIM-barrel fold metal-dependent hydrolase
MPTIAPRGSRKITGDFMHTHRQFRSFRLAFMLGLAAACAPACAQNSLPFKLFDTHAHFVAGDLERYPMRTDAPYNEHARDMRGYLRQRPNTAERILGAWDANGVEGGVAVQYRIAYDTNNNYLLDSATRSPDRITGVVILEPADPKTPDLLRAIVKDRRAAGIRMTGPADVVADSVPWLDSAAAQNTWAAANELGIAVVLMPSEPGGRDVMERIRKLAEKYPRTRIVLDHFTWPTPEGAPNYGFGPGHVALKAYRNVYYKFSTLNLERLRKADIPASDFLRHAIDLYGADHVMWGSDTGNNKMEYADLVNRAIAASAKLAPTEQRQLLHDTGKAVFVGGGHPR